MKPRLRFTAKEMAALVEALNIRLCGEYDDGDIDEIACKSALAKLQARRSQQGESK